MKLCRTELAAPGVRDAAALFDKVVMEAVAAEEERKLLGEVVAFSGAPLCSAARACGSAGHSKCTQWNTSFAVFLVPVMRTKTTTCGSLSGITCQDLRAQQAHTYRTRNVRHKVGMSIHRLGIM